MTTVTDKFYSDYAGAIFENLQKHPGCYLIWELHRNVAPDSSYQPFQALLHELSKAKKLEKRKLNGALVAYCLPGYDGPVSVRDAAYYARKKVIEFLPGAKPQHIDQICRDTHSARSTILPVLRELIAEGRVRLVVQNRVKYYEWVKQNG